MRDIAEEWLKDNDTQYKHRHKSDYPYLNGAQMNYRISREIAVTSLNTMTVQNRTGMTKESLTEIMLIMQ